MPSIEIELTEDGRVGKLPEPVQKLLDDKYREAFGKGAEKAANEAKAQLVEAEKRAREEALKGVDLATVEKNKTLEMELSKLREAKAREESRTADVLAERDKQHALQLEGLTEKLKEVDAKSAADRAELERRTGRIRHIATKEIRAEAANAGARAESLDELEYLLSSRLGLDETTLDVFVKDTADPSKPALGDDGKPLSIEGLVTKYLADHPHHKSAPAGRGGRPVNGRSLSGQPTNTADAEFQRVVEDVDKDPSIANVARAFAQVGKRGAA